LKSNLLILFESLFKFYVWYNCYFPPDEIFGLCPPIPLELTAPACLGADGMPLPEAEMPVEIVAVDP
jgi:hypothetical protein